jgi:hypothetical protein
MSNLEPSVVALDSGLNLQTAKIIAPPGSVLDTLNYEQVDFQGQKRIDGYARYDGSELSDQDDYLELTLEDSVGVSDLIRGLLFSTLSDGSKHVIGVVADTELNKVYLALVDYNNIPEAGATLTFLKEDNTEASFVLESVTWGAASGATVDEQYQEVLDVNSTLRNKVEALPGGIIGLQWFRDRLYAVADVATMYLDGSSPQIFPNDVLNIGPFEATVLDSFVDGSVRVVFLDTLNTLPWYTSGNSVTRDGNPVGTISSDLSSSLEAIASFFESRTEQQALDEDITDPDYGWRFRHLGWEVLFENGNSLFGSLPSTNQNLQNLGVQGPTSTTGNNGRPLILLQKVSITNGQAQVNGWKSSQTPTSYLLDPDDLTDVDSDYTYADAYFSWDGSSGQISQAGVSTGSLQEYSATATVEVDV